MRLLLLRFAWVRMVLLKFAQRDSAREVRKHKRCAAQVNAREIGDW